MEAAQRFGQAFEVLCSALPHSNQREGRAYPAPGFHCGYKQCLARLGVRFQ